MSLVVANPTPYERTRTWVTWTQKSTLAPGAVGFFKVEDREDLCVAGAPIAPGIQLAHTLVSKIGPGARLTGQVDWRPELDQALPGWSPSSWVMNSGIAKAALEVVLPNGDVHTLNFSWCKDTTIVETGEVRRVTRIRGRVPGTQFVAELWCYLYSETDYVPFELLVTASDPTTTEMIQEISSMNLLCPELPFLAAGRSRGAGQTRFNDVGKHWSVRLCDSTWLGDGQSLAFYGSFLLKPTIEAPDTAERMRNVAAQSVHPLVAMDADWRFAWGPMPTHVPKGGSDVDAHVVQLCRNHQANLMRIGTPWDQTPFGQDRQPGRTGDQQGFGAAKCFEALTVGRPEFLIPAYYSAVHSLACRPVNMRESDGAPVRAEAHPRWITWDERTHWHPDVSKDRLGKPPYAEVPAHDWWGRDDQHNQPLFEIGTYALTGSWMLRDLLDVVAERMLSGQTIPSFHGQTSTNSMGAARGIGRLNITASWLAWATGRRDLTPRLHRRVVECISQQWHGKNLTSGVRILELYHDPRLPQGCGWRPVFESMGVFGLYLLWRETQGEGEFEIAYQVVKSVVKYGIRTRDGMPRVAWGLWYPENRGGVLEEPEYDDPEKASWGGGDWEAWSYAGVAVGLNLAEKAGDADLAVQCKSILEAWDKQEFKDPAKWLRWHEWAAV